MKNLINSTRSLEVFWKELLSMFNSSNLFLDTKKHPKEGLIMCDIDLQMRQSSE